MSQYTFLSEHGRYRVIVGVDAPRSTFFAQVEDVGEQGIRAHGEMGKTPDERLLVWAGTSVREILDVQKIAEAVAPYGRLPLPLQVQLLQDLDRVVPQPLMVLGTQLAVICQQSPVARLPYEPDPQKRYYLFLNQEGWHLCDWPPLPADALTQLFALLLSPTQEESFRPVPETLVHYSSDPSIVFSIDEYGFARRLPVFALFTRGAMLSGPVVISNDGEGLTAAQVRTVRREVLFVDKELRPAVTSLWYHAWRTIITRGVVTQH
jgi:hypothetical protein